LVGSDCSFSQHSRTRPARSVSFNKSIAKPLR
jgi:hypothetical protein